MCVRDENDDTHTTHERTRCRMSATESRPARMRRLLAEEKACDCGKPAVLRVPTHTNGGYESYCLECGTGFSWDAAADLNAMLEAIDRDTHTATC